ncbi:hypothetical protein [Shinella pollutisoli]|uniref:Uncharacterized protein n=1 Tax=Shinella pollutisoli TaxID=2250594 RepID=A0ABV7DJ17_9HYPH|nr:hypothetical protein [Shinella pollutisoli]
MTLWTCIHCGAVERLTFFPDGCSSCGGPMESEDRRTTFAEEPEIPFEVYHLAAEGDAAATIDLWHAGAPRSAYRQDVLDELLLRNRHEQLVALFGEVA